MDRGADGDDFVGIHAPVRLLAEEVLHDLNDFRHAGHAADQHDFVDVAGRHAGVGQRLSAGLDRALDQVVDQLFQPGAGQLDDHVLGAAGVRRDEGQIDFCFLRGGQLDLGAFCRFFQPLEGHAILAEIDALILPEFIDEPIHDAEIEVVAAQIGVAVGGFDLEDAFADLEHGDVEGAAAQIVDGDPLVFFLVETVGQRRGGRLVDDAQDVQIRRSGPRLSSPGAGCRRNRPGR